jgi:hypothetical protein
VQCHDWEAAPVALTVTTAEGITPVQVFPVASPFVVQAADADDAPEQAEMMSAAATQIVLNRLDIFPSLRGHVASRFDEV